VKIVQLVNNLELGGVERLAVELARCQKDAGHTPLIYCLTHPGYFVKEAEASEIRVRAFHKSRGPSPGTVRTIMEALKRDRPDVLHTHNHLVHHYGVVAGRLAGVPVIVNTRHRAEMQIREQNTGYAITPESPDKKADMIYRATLRWTDAVVFISETTRQFFVEHRGVPAHKTHVILNGAPLDRFECCPARPGSAHPRIRFGTASRMVPVKDHFTLLAAFARAARSLPHAELHVAGDGPLYSRIRAFIDKLGLSDKVILHGALRGMPDFLQGLDIFAMASLNEGLPIVILEAMAAGLPIVSTRAGGIHEAAMEGCNARFAEPGDVNGLALQMIAMARSTDLAQIGARGRTMVAQRFRIDRTWSEHEDLFHRLDPMRRRNPQTN
jgi:glycosyltransferase involved in cell wall biosynthesis